ncbi:hypothetical protein FO519_006761 [Halicephalobus sp. NKZ332]|nr:hypothetical protein FO519_006761 [Halicephalobus sp. NKZ332]
METAKQITILDGGTGFQLNSVSDSPLWGSQMLETDSEKVRIVHENFIKAGAQILYSNTYSLHLKSDDEEEKKRISTLFEENIKILEDLVRSYPGTDYFISIGPFAVFYRDCSEYSGVYLKDERKICESDVLRHYEQMLDLVEATGKKHVVFETIPSFLEVKAALKAIEKHEKMKCFLTVYAADEEKTGAGDRIEDISRLVNKSEKVEAFGVNCCDPRLCVPISNTLSKILKPEIPIVIKPNCGKYYNLDSKEYEGESYDLRKDIPELYKNKVRFIGGCCTVGPETIKEYKDFIEEWQYGPE